MHLIQHSNMKKASPISTTEQYSLLCSQVISPYLRFRTQREYNADITLLDLHLFMNTVQHFSKLLLKEVSESISLLHDTPFWLEIYV